MEDSLTTKIEIAARILREAGATGVYIFGSAGDESEMLPGRAPRDIDLAVEGLPPAELCRVIGRILAEVRYPVDLLDLDRPSPLAQRLVERGRLRRVA